MTEPSIPDQWLSQGVERLLAKEAPGSGGVDTDIDVLIVGSGYGASVAAARFAGQRRAADGRALRVVLLERGDEHLPGQFPDRFEQALPHVRAERPLDTAPPVAVTQGRTGLDPALFDLHLGKEVTALVGDGLGGGSLINANVVEPAQDDVFAQDAWPAALRPHAGQPAPIAAHYEEVRRMLGARAFAPTSPKAQALVDDLDAMARVLKFQPATRAPDIAVTQADGVNAQGVAQRACVRCGNCVTGCNYWAKNTLPMNYLALARRRGAELYTGATVIAVVPRGDGARDGWQVLLRRTHDRRNFDAPGSVHALLARQVVLAAGTFGTTQVLMQSASMPAANAVLGHLVDKDKGQLGRRISCNGDNIAALHDQRRVTPVAAFGAAPPVAASGQAVVGPTITGMVDLRGRHELAKRFVIQDAAIPFPLARLAEEALTTFGAIHRMTDWNDRDDAGEPLEDALALSEDRTARSQTLLQVGHDDAGWQLDLMMSDTIAGGRGGPKLGRVSIAPRRPDHPHPNDAFQPVRDHQKDMDGLLGLMTQGRWGGKYVPNPLWAPAPDDLLSALRPQGADADGAVDTVASQRGITVHPLGGCAMSDDPARGVTNHLGQVWSRSGAALGSLVVMDGSLMPTSLGINPLMTIAALAERACQELGRAWGFAPGTGALQALPPQPAQAAPLPWSERPTAIGFEETMTGGVALQVDPYPDTAWRADSPERAMRRDMEAQLTVRADIASLERFCRDPRHPVDRASARLLMAWLAPPTAGDTRRGAHEVRQVAVTIPRLPLALLELLPSTREDRVWRAMAEWRAVRGQAFLHDQFKSSFERAAALEVISTFLRIKSPWLRRLALKAVETVGAWGQVGAQDLALLKVASHHGEARTLRYDLGTLQPVPGQPWPFTGAVRVLAAKRLHYGRSPGYRQRALLGRPVQGLLPEQVPAMFPRSLMELHVLYVSSEQGPAVTDEDWPADQWPADLPRQHARVVGRGTWTLDARPLLTDAMPQLRGYATLPDAWLDLLSVGALAFRAGLQTGFWRLRLPAYPEPLPDAGPQPAGIGAPDGDVGPLPGMALHRHADGRTAYVEDHDLFPGVAWERLDPIAMPGEGAPQIVLTRFTPRSGVTRRHPVLFIHAFVVSGYMFTTPRMKVNAMQALVAEGYDCWVVELRTSVALRCSHRAWDFDEVARNDVPAAIQRVHDVTGQRVHVVAQCMGSAVFNMAVLEGRVKDMVRSSVQVQVSMDVVPSGPNHVKAAAVEMIQDILDMKELTVVADKRTLQAGHTAAALLDRLLWTYPNNDRDAALMDDNALEQDRPTELATVHRITALYGRNFSWENLAPEMRTHLPEIFRHASTKAVRHLLQMQRAGRVVDAQGKDCYVSDQAIQQHYDFPVLFVHGPFNGVFAPATTRRSQLRLRRLQPDVVHERIMLRKAGLPKGPVDIKPEHPEARPWGHFDVWIGQDAAAEVFPHLARFLGRHDGPWVPPPGPLPQPDPVQLLPDLPPRLGWWRPSTTPGVPAGTGRARLWFADPFHVKDEVDTAVWAIRLMPPSVLPPIPPVTVPVTTVQVKVTCLAPYAPVQLLGRCGAIDVDIPPEHQGAMIAVTCQAVVGALFQDPDYASLGQGNGVWFQEQDSRVPGSFFRTDADDGSTPQAAPPRFKRTGPFGIGPQVLDDLHFGRAVSPQALALLASLAAEGPGLVIDGAPAPASPPVPGAPLVQVLTVEAPTSAERAATLRLDERSFRQFQPADDVCFLLASCRYQATGLERDQADRALLPALQEQTLAALDFALLVGDQIYADASYGVFDSRPSAERLRSKYRDLWRGAAGQLGTRVPLYLCVDDHEIRDDWFEGLRATADQAVNDDDARKALRAFQLVGAPCGLPCAPAVPCCHYPFSARGFHAYVLDARTERLEPGTSLWSTTQRASFERWVRQSAPDDGRPLLIVSSVPVFPRNANAGTPEDRQRGDGWTAYPDSLRELVDALFAAPELRRVVFLAGDPHLSHWAAGSLQRGGRTIEFDSVVSSGINAPIPFSGWLRRDVLETWEALAGTPEAVAPGTDARYVTRGCSDDDGFAQVRIERAGAGDWRVDAQFHARRVVPATT